MIIGINAMVIGFGLLFGGLGALVAPSEDKTNELRRAYEVARERSWFHGQLEALRQASQARSRRFQLVADHWLERPQGRMLMYCGAACWAVAALIGYHFGVFS